MAIDKLDISSQWPLSLFWRDGTTGALLRKQFGAVLPTLGIGTAISYGTGSGQCSWGYYASRALATVTYDDLDLYGSLTDGLGNTINAATLKLAVLAIASPDGTKKLRVGPQNRTNPFQGPWGGTGATVYTEFTHWAMPVYSPVSGYAVANGSTDKFSVYNPTGSSITYHILLAGTS